MTKKELLHLLEELLQAAMTRAYIKHQSTNDLNHLRDAVLEAIVKENQNENTL